MWYEYSIPGTDASITVEGCDCEFLTPGGTSTGYFQMTRCPKSEEKDGWLHLTYELPGRSKKDVKVYLKDGIVHVSGQDKYRDVSLPTRFPANGCVKATMTDGLLTVNIRGNPDVEVPIE